MTKIYHSRWCSLFLIAISIQVLLTPAQGQQENYTLPIPDIPGFPKASNGSSETGQFEYQKLLAYSLYFYEAQRSGKLPPDNRVSWRHDSALQDGQDNNVDLTQGYYDAGDYMKFTLPLSWTITSISWGAIEWFGGYELANQTQYIHDMIKWGTDWLIKAHSQSNVLYVQVGLEDVDNNYWGPDTGIPTPRPSFNVNGSSHGTDVAAETAAAMAAASILFRTKFNDTSYAQTLISHAEDLYSFAESPPLTVYQNSVPQVANIYPSSNYSDELVWGALWLYQATTNNTYLQKANYYYNSLGVSGQNRPANWDAKYGACYVLFSMLDQQNSSGYKQEAERYLDGMIHQTNDCHLTNGGLLWCDGDSDSASLNPSLNIAFLCLLYAPIASTSDKSKQYRDFAMSQIDYLLGKNPEHTPYVIGVHPNSPQNPHHAGASGGSDISNLNNPPKTQHILYGAIVGGPDKSDQFSDDRSDWKETEVALDYNAPFQGIMSYQVMNANSGPYYVTLPPGRPNLSSSKNTLLIIIFVIVGVILIASAGLLIWKRKKIAKWFKIAKNDRYK